MSSYLQLAGVVANSKNSRFPGWFPILSVSFGTGRTAGSNRRISDELRFTVNDGVDVVDLFRAAAEGRPFEWAKLALSTPLETRSLN